MKKCPFCGADIEDSARFCLYCMQSLTEKEQILHHKKKKPQWPMAVAAIVALMILAMLLLPTVSGTPSENPESPSTLPSGTPGSTTSQSEPSTPPTTESTVPPTTETTVPPTTETTVPPTTEAPVPPHSHSYSLKNTATEYRKEEATCTSAAVYYYSCVCGEKGSSTFSHGEKKAHSIVTDPGYPSTCVTPGLSEGTHCSVCSTVFLAQTQTPVSSHTYDNNRDEICNVCNYVRVVSCDHTQTVTLPAVSPTCTAGGLTEGKKCALCEDILTAQTSLAPLGHTEVTDQAIAPTCTADGKTEGKHCATCNAVLVAQVKVTAKGHTEVIDQAIAATCTTLGKTEGTHCSVCQKVLIPQQSLPALGHRFEDSFSPCSACGAPSTHTHNHCVANTNTEYLKEEATCTSAAVYYYSCICGEKGNSTFSHGEKKAHSIVTDPGYPASCTTPGLSEGTHCSVCQATLTPQKQLPALGHTFAPGDPSACSVCGAPPPHTHSFSEKNTADKYLKEEATCSALAVYYYSCACGEKGSDTFTHGTLKPHSIVTVSGYPAGCTTPGLADHKYCSVCQDTFEYPHQILAKGHTFQPGDSLSACLVCGQMGTVIVQAPEFPIIQNGKFRIDSCTYTIQPSIEETWEFVFSVNFTNLSSTETVQCPSASLDLLEAGYGFGGVYSVWSVPPNESGTCLVHFRVPNSESTYILVFN